MNKPHKYAEVIKAWADGKDIQWKEYMQDKPDVWRDHIVGCVPNFNLCEWRIKPEVLRYRVYLKRYSGKERPFPAIAENEEQAQVQQTEAGFVKWITDWIDVEI